MQDKVHFEVEVLRPGPPSVANPRPQSLCARLRPFAHASAMVCATLRQAPSASACAGPTSTRHGRWTFRPTAGRWWPPRGRSPLATRKRSRSTSPSSSPCPTSSYVVVVDVRRAKLPTHGMGWPLTRASYRVPCRPSIQGCVFDQETGQIGFYHNGRPLSFVSPLTAKRLRGQLALAVSGTLRPAPSPGPGPPIAPCRPAHRPIPSPRRPAPPSPHPSPRPFS